jgi:hypothetical protein
MANPFSRPATYSLSSLFRVSVLPVITHPICSLCEHFIRFLDVEKNAD